MVKIELYVPGLKIREMTDIAYLDIVEGSRGIRYRAYGTHTDPNTKKIHKVNSLISKDVYDSAMLEMGTALESIESVGDACPQCNVEIDEVAICSLCDIRCCMGCRDTTNWTHDKNLVSDSQSGDICHSCKESVCPSCQCYLSNIDSYCGMGCLKCFECCGGCPSPDGSWVCGISFSSESPLEAGPTDQGGPTEPDNTGVPADVGGDESVPMGDEPSDIDAFEADTVGEIDYEGRVTFCDDDGKGSACEESYCHRCNPIEGCTNHDKCQEIERFNAKETQKYKISLTDGRLTRPGGYDKVYNAIDFLRTNNLTITLQTVGKELDKDGLMTTDEKEAFYYIMNENNNDTFEAETPLIWEHLYVVAENQAGGWEACDVGGGILHTFTTQAEAQESAENTINELNEMSDSDMISYGPDFWAGVKITDCDIGDNVENIEYPNGKIVSWPLVASANLGLHAETEDNILLMTSSMSDDKISETLGIVRSEVVLGANIFKDTMAGIRDTIGGRSGNYERIIERLTTKAELELKSRAKQMGADAVTDMKVDIEPVGSKGSMFACSMSGTAVKLNESFSAEMTLKEWGETELEESKHDFKNNPNESFKVWLNQEILAHGKNISFKDWAEEEETDEPIITKSAEFAITYHSPSEMTQKTKETQMAIALGIPPSIWHNMGKLGNQEEYLESLFFEVGIDYIRDLENQEDFQVIMALTNNVKETTTSGDLSLVICNVCGISQENLLTELGGVCSITDPNEGANPNFQLGMDCPWQKYNSMVEAVELSEDKLREDRVVIRQRPRQVAMAAETTPNVIAKYLPALQNIETSLEKSLILSSETFNAPHCEECDKVFEPGDNMHDTNYETVCELCYGNWKIPCRVMACNEMFKDTESEQVHRDENCSHCEDGFVLTSYIPATRDDPADGDGHDCEMCQGTGAICDEDQSPVTFSIYQTSESKAEEVSWWMSMKNSCGDNNCGDGHCPNCGSCRGWDEDEDEEGNKTGMNYCGSCGHTFYAENFSAFESFEAPSGHSNYMKQGFDIGREGDGTSAIYYIIKGNNHIQLDYDRRTDYGNRPHAREYPYNYGIDSQYNNYSEEDFQTLQEALNWFDTQIKGGRVFMDFGSNPNWNVESYESTRGIDTFTDPFEDEDVEGKTNWLVAGGLAAIGALGALFLMQKGR